VRGVLLDIDGTLLAGDREIPGAAAVLDRLRAAGVPFRLATNTSRRSRNAIALALRAAGFRVEAHEILTPAVQARRHILDSGRIRAALLVTEDTRADLSGVEPDDEHPAWMVLGDLGPGFTYERMNAAFRCLRQGAGFLALHRNRFWHAGDLGWVLDVGAYVAALECASGIRAELMGKPSVDFFHLALADLGLPAGEVLVVGDDPETDVAGGAAAGCRTAWVRTGHQAGNGPGDAGPRPDILLDSVAGLI
jgi:HAD superfamily hydrolase (TIGR01458 family)